MTLSVTPEHAEPPAEVKFASKEPDIHLVNELRRRGTTWALPSRAIGIAFSLVTSILSLIVTTAAPVSALTTASQISAGGRTACAVMTGGAAYCWGDNTYGQLGDGTTTSSATPVLVSGGYTWASISTEYTSTVGSLTATTCGVTTGGTGYCWGYNDHGQVGDGTTTQRNSPTLVSGAHTWASFSIGYEDVCGVTTAGAGYCWGYNVAGEVGDNTAIQRTSPTSVSGGYTWASISIGNQFSCGVTTGNVGYCWGLNSGGQLGIGNTTTQHVPTVVSGSYSWSTLSAGHGNACGVTTSGSGYCWGSNNVGQGGNGATGQNTTPTAVSGSYTWSTISVGHKSVCGLTTSQQTYCWGGNAGGEVGDGTNTQRTSPAAVSGGQTFSSVDTGADDPTDDTNCGLAQDGIVYCWGYNNESQVGDNTTTNRNVATEASYLFAATSTSTMSAIVDPSFTFTVANQASACNGESNFLSGAGTATTIALGHEAISSNTSGGQALTVSGNSGNGFSVYIRGTQASQNLRSTGHNWTDVAGTYASPAGLGSGERFGYTYKDSTTSSSVTNPSSAGFVALDNATTNAVMGSGSSETGSGCVSFDAQTGVATPAGSYTATIVYTAVPTF